MWPFKKKEKAPDPGAQAAGGGEEKEEKASLIPEDATLAQKINLIGIELTKINATLESLKETRKSTSERFSLITEQMGEIRGQLMDTNKSIGQIEVKATKAADLVESVQPDKMMISLQKTDGKIEGVKAALEAKDAMMRNIMEQLKEIRSQMSLFKGVEQIIKLNEDVKDEIMNAKKIVANVERHADKVENVFVESQKSFEEFNRFAASLESIRSDIKELQGKEEKVEVKVGTFLTKKEFEDKFNIIEQSDKHMKSLVKKLEKLDKDIDIKVEEAKGEIKGKFDHSIARAEIMSNAFEHIIKDNPMFAKGLDLQKYVDQFLAGKKDEEKKAAPVEKKEEKKEEEKKP
jgi:chromosome segregation ATPase